MKEEKKGKENQPFVFPKTKDLPLHKTKSDRNLSFLLASETADSLQCPCPSSSSTPHFLIFWSENGSLYWTLRSSASPALLFGVVTEAQGQVIPIFSPSVSYHLEMDLGGPAATWDKSGSHTQEDNKMALVWTYNLTEGHTGLEIPQDFSVWEKNKHWLCIRNGHFSSNFQSNLIPILILHYKREIHFCFCYLEIFLYEGMSFSVSRRWKFF